jgi:hypothetical protein
MFGRDTRCTCLDACTYTLVACLPPFGYSDPLKSGLVPPNLNIRLGYIVNFIFY